MIDAALTYVAGALDAHMAGLPDASGGPHVTLSALVDRDGPLDEGIEGRLVLTLAGVERARTGAQTPAAVLSDDTGADRLARPEPMHLNLHLLVTATLQAGVPSNGYAAALSRLSRAIGFFRSSEVMTPHSAPGLPDGIERLVFDFSAAGRDDLLHLWGVFGGGYLPSVLYRVRMISIAADTRLDLSAPVTRIGVTPRRRS